MKKFFGITLMALALVCPTGEAKADVVTVKLKVKEINPGESVTIRIAGNFHLNSGFQLDSLEVASRVKTIHLVKGTDGAVFELVTLRGTPAKTIVLWTEGEAEVNIVEGKGWIESVDIRKK